MRFRVDVATAASKMPWGDVHGAARGVVYDVIRRQDPALAAELHDKGWQGCSLRPFGVSPPVFAGGGRRKGVYMTSAQGALWLGSPVPQIAASLLAGAVGRQEIRWGSVELRVRGVRWEPAPDHSSGTAVFSTRSPVLLKHEDRYLLPGDDHFLDRLVHNLRHKADVLRLPNEVDVQVLEAGPRRRFEVARRLRVGACVRLRVSAASTLLDALYDWGLGLGTAEGFGWVR